VWLEELSCGSAASSRHRIAIAGLETDNGVLSRKWYVETDNGASISLLSP